MSETAKILAISIPLIAGLFALLYLIERAGDSFKARAARKKPSAVARNWGQILLGTAAKRLGLVMLVIGVTVIAFGYSRLGHFTSFGDCFAYMDKRNGCSLIRAGTAVSAFSIVFLYGFGLLVRPLLRWIRHGNPPRNR